MKKRFYRFEFAGWFASYNVTADNLMEALGKLEHCIPESGRYLPSTSTPEPFAPWLDKTLKSLTVFENSEYKEEPAK